MKYFSRHYNYGAFVFLILILWVKESSAQQYVQEFSHIAKITFPSKPHYNSNKTDTLYTLKFHSNIYALSMHSFRKDTDFTLDSGKLKSFYKDFIRQMIKMPNVSLIYNKPVIICGLEGIEIKYKIRFKNRVTNTDTTYISYHRILYVNRTIYNYGFSMPNDSDKIVITLKNDFINSLIITEKKENLYQFYEVDDDDNSKSKELAALVVKILVIIVKMAVIGVVLGLLIKGLIYITQ